MFSKKSIPLFTVLIANLAQELMEIDAGELEKYST